MPTADFYATFEDEQQGLISLRRRLKRQKIERKNLARKPIVPKFIEDELKEEEEEKRSKENALSARKAFLKNVAKTYRERINGDKQ